jgi:hypothetical protein
MTGKLSISEGQVAKWEAAFGVLTEQERELLTTQDGLLTPIDQQRRQVLIWYLEPMECPACQKMVPPRQALGHPIDHAAIEDGFVCPYCRRALSKTMPFIGRSYWRLVVPLGPAGPDEMALPPS